MYLLNDKEPNEIEKTTFSDLGMRESDIEEILRKNINMISDGSSMLIVGQQVVDEKKCRSDLTAVDGQGNIVLIEIKRDKKDIVHRNEAFEFQAIRYAAVCATIKDTDVLVQYVYAPYVEKHKSEYTASDALTSSEIAARNLKDFFDTNDVKVFNEHQRIILVASEFDDQTLSAVAWLNSNQVDISCFQIIPYKLNDNVIIDMKKLLPVSEYTDFYIKIAAQSNLVQGAKKESTRITLPKIDDLLRNQVIKAESRLKAKDRESYAVLQSDGLVKIEATGQITSLQQWLKAVYGWSAVETYAMTIDTETGKTLAQLRSEWMAKEEQES